MALRVAFFGTPAFAVPTLAPLLRSSHRVVGVVTQPDRPRGRGQRVSDGPVKALALAAGVAVLQPERLAREAFEAPLTALAADIGVVAAYGKILPDWLLAGPRLGLINVHASLLPRYRGASPIQRAVMAGETATGITIMRVVKALDAGPMLSKVTVPIGPDDTTPMLQAVLAERGAELLVTTLDAIETGRATETPQDEALATYAPKLTKAEGVIDWNQPASQVHNLVRGLCPWPHAYSWVGGVRHILHRTRVGAARSIGTPGTVFRASAADGLLVACGHETTLEILELQLEGKRVLSARDMMATGALRPGSRFTTP